MDAVVHALGDTVGPDGTVMAFCGWEDSPYHVAGWPAEWQQAYQDQPAFDPAVSGHDAISVVSLSGCVRGPAPSGAVTLR